MNAIHTQVADGPPSTVPTVFLTKAYQLVDDPCVDHIISWTGNGSTFVIWSPGHFARDIHPHKFEHNFTSFICQLNTYGFRMISPNPCEFVHEFFRRGEKHLLDRIVRRRSSSGSTSPSSGDEPVLWSDSNGETIELWKENERLKCENTWLTLENEKMKILFDNIRHRLSNYSGDGGGDDGRRLQATVAAGITGGEGRQNNDVQVGSRQAQEEWESPLEGPSGSEDSEFYPGE